MEDNGFREKMNLKSNEELLDILEFKRNDYQEKAILDIENVMKERGVEYHIAPITEPIKEESASQIQENNIYWPLVVGIILVLVSLITPSAESRDAVSTNLTINIIFRAIVMVWSYNLCERFYFKKPSWMILGLVFGGWSLIAINVAVWIKESKEKEEKEEEELLQQ